MDQSSTSSKSERGLTKNDKVESINTHSEFIESEKRDKIVQRQNSCHETITVVQ